MASKQILDLPRRTANPAPPRPTGSIRRTSSVDVFWPEGVHSPRKYIGSARDYRTPASGGPGEVVARAQLEARLDEDKTILEISADPAPENLSDLVGQRAGGHLRMFVAQAMPQLLERADPLYLPIDDLSGCALVSSFALAQWSEDLNPLHSMTDAEFEEGRRQRTDICWGLKAGNSGLDPDRANASFALCDAGELRNPADPEGWHEFPAGDGPAFRRARRIDVVHDREAGLLRIDSAFQDSAALQDGGRTAIHEYRLSAIADARTLELMSLTPEPRILPFQECPGAVHNAQRMVGACLPEIREEVLAKLRKTAGCTHLNDAMRALADVPVLARYLETSQPLTL